MVAEGRVGSREICGVAAPSRCLQKAGEDAGEEAGR